MTPEAFSIGSTKPTRGRQSFEALKRDPDDDILLIRIRSRTLEIGHFRKCLFPNAYSGFRVIRIAESFNVIQAPTETPSVFLCTKSGELFVVVTMELQALGRNDR
jgi:hypothetical protein